MWHNQNSDWSTAAAISLAAPSHWYPAYSNYLMTIWLFWHGAPCGWQFGNVLAIWERVGSSTVLINAVLFNHLSVCIRNPKVLIPSKTSLPTPSHCHHQPVLFILNRMGPRFFIHQKCKRDCICLTSNSITLLSGPVLMYLCPLSLSSYLAMSHMAEQYIKWNQHFDSITNESVISHSWCL